jgi:DNA-binding transcriptional LysR family regulator
MATGIALNLYHLKSFYYVVKFGGVAAAAQNGPERVERSTFSRQVTLLEKETGLKLLERRPLRVTPAGEKIYAFIKPIYEGLPILVEQLRRGEVHMIRVGAPPIVMREYLPGIVDEVEPKFPGMHLECVEGLQWQIDEEFTAGRLDLAVTMLDEELPEGCLSQVLLSLPMVLLVAEKSPIRYAAQLWKRGQPVTHRLITPKGSDTMLRCFRRGLRRRKVEWKSGHEASSFEMAENQARKGSGVAISLAIPGRSYGPGLRVLPLRGFPFVKIGMIWRPNPNAATLALMEAMRKRAKRMTKRRT